MLEPSPRQFDKAGSCRDGESTDESACANPDFISDASFTADRRFVSDEVAALIEEFDAKSETGTLDDLLQFMLDWGGGVGPRVAAGRYTSFRSRADEPRPTLAQWHNPVSTPLPLASSMKIYCLYGIGVETERGYIYKRNLGDDNSTELLDPPYVIDTEYNDPEGGIKSGVRSSDGDGSVPLLSLGYLCTDGWTNNKRLNPSEIQVVTKEYKHEAEFSMYDPMRAGPKAGEHCDILGNEEMTLDVLKIATGTDSVESRIISNIKEIAKKIDGHELGGLRYFSTAESRFKPDPVNVH